MMRTAMCLMVLVLVSGLTAGCGQKGPLERPPEPASAVTPATDDTENR